MRFLFVYLLNCSTRSGECPTCAKHYVAAKSLQSCLTLCDPIDSSPPGSPIPGILQARTLEWVAIFFSNAWKWKVKVKSLNHVRLLATPWTAAYHAPSSMGFSRQEYWSGVPLPSLTNSLGIFDSKILFKDVPYTAEYMCASYFFLFFGKTVPKRSSRKHTLFHP